MFREVLALLTLPLLISNTASAVTGFLKFHISQQLWEVALLSLFWGLWVAVLSPQTIWKIYRDNKLGLLFPGVILGALIVPYLGTALGIGITATGFVAFWVAARSVESFLSGMGHRKLSHN